MQEPKPPFSFTYTPSLPELLMTLRCSILLSTYQAGKVVVISPRSDEKLIQLPRSFQKPMGIALSPDGQDMAIATQDTVVQLRNSTELAWHYPKKPGTYDGMFLPRVSYHTNALDIHDLAFVNEGLVAVNTLFSCIMRISKEYSFEPVWQPAFVDGVSAEDRCHLNGIAATPDGIRYATAFGQTNTARGWTATIPNSGIVMDVQSNTVITENLAMPHSPRMVEDRLFVLLSATGQLVEVDTASGKMIEVRKLKGFVRGMAFHGGYLFVGHSRLRSNSSSFGKLDLPYETRYAGVSVIHLETGSLVGEITYQQSVDEIYDVQVLPGLIRPNILTTLNEEHKTGLSTPTRTYWGKMNT